MVHRQRTHYHQVVAEVGAGLGDAAGTDAVATRFERTVGAGLRRHRAEGKDSGTAGAVAVGVGVARGSGCGQGLNVVAAVQVLGAGNRVAGCRAVGEGGVGHGNEQPVCGHDGVSARRKGNGVVAVISRSTRGRERVGVGARQGVGPTGVAVWPRAIAGNGKAAQAQHAGGFAVDKTAVADTVVATRTRHITGGGVAACIGLRHKLGV